MAVKSTISVKARVPEDSIIDASTNTTLVKKYEFTGESKPFVGDIVLHRIRALVDIPRIGVRAGDLGGWIEKEENLSHEGTCWVGGDAWVYGDAVVYEDAHVRGDAWIAENAAVFGSANVYGMAQISGCAWLFGETEVFGNARVSGRSWVGGTARLYGSVSVSGSAILENGNHWFGEITR